MSGRCPRLVIAGTASGVGKTSLTLGVVRALSRRGLTVATFKVGPDFLDPTYLALASGRACYNLDGWMTDRNYVCELFARASAGVNIAVIEGVMGLFDGASPTGLEGSTGEIAAWLDAPVLLAVNAHGAARSLAAMVKGFAEFEASVRVAGVIANHTGGDSHRATLQKALEAGPGRGTGRIAPLPPLLGAVPRGSLPTLASRHLGLVTADADSLSDQTIDQLADACEKHLDIERIMEIARGGPSIVQDSFTAKGQADCHVGRVRHTTVGGGCATSTKKVRIGVARDAAFHFYYPDNLQLLADCGAELVEFSPLADSTLPADLAGLYLGGGYPEVHAARLAGNGAMLDAVRRFAASGRCVYAECGGLIYLGRSVRTLDGRAWPLAGVVPIDTAMLPALKTLGYIEAELQADSLWGGRGQKLRGHEFHYSEIAADDSAAAGWQPAYSLRRRRNDARQTEGFARDGVLASYVHLHFASRPDAARCFVTRCEASL